MSFKNYTKQTKQNAHSFSTVFVKLQEWNPVRKNLLL